FGAGSTQTIPIRLFQACLLKAALMLGVHLMKSSTVSNIRAGKKAMWEAVVEVGGTRKEKGREEVIEFDCLFICDGDASFERGGLATLCGIDAKYSRGSLAIGMTFNFVNQGTKQDKKVRDTKLAVQYDSKGIFPALKKACGLEMENVVLFTCEENHYFVTTPKKSSLLQTGILKESKTITKGLLRRKNIDKKMLLEACRQIGTHPLFGIPSKAPFCEKVDDFDDATDGVGSKEDVALFDFSKKHVAGSSIKALDKMETVLAYVVGDALLTPFWPQGTGANHAILSSLDAAYAFRNACIVEREGKTKDIKQVMKEREGLFRAMRTTG
ncbi:hypothetical protein AAMO2058_001370700, partial [Amorphochlora amoebiformis]